MSSAAVVRRHHRHLAAVGGEEPQDVAFDAVVDRDHVEFGRVLAAVALAPFPRRLVPGEALARGHHRHQVHADQARPLARFLLERIEIELAVSRMRDHGVRHALGADQAGERAGVDAGEPDDAARLEPLVEVPRRPVVRGVGDVGAQDDAARARRRRHVDGLDVLLVGADIADVGKREGDDLPGIGGIGQDLLVSGHGGVEADFADRGPVAPRPNPSRTVPSASTSNAVALGSGQAVSSCLAVIGRLHSRRFCRRQRGLSAPNPKFGTPVLQIRLRTSGSKGR